MCLRGGGAIGREEGQFAKQVKTPSERGFSLVAARLMKKIIRIHKIVQMTSVTVFFLPSLTTSFFADA